jgi:hypothetical protein
MEAIMNDQDSFTSETMRSYHTLGSVQCRHQNRYLVNALTALSTLLFALSALAATIPPFSAFQLIGDTSNYTNPGLWEARRIDITSFVAGASSAVLTFDVANDLPGAPSTAVNQPTTAHLYLASSSGQYFLNFEWFFVPASANSPAGTASVHFRDVRLTINSVLYRDQFLSSNNDLGDPFLGTARDG